MVHITTREHGDIPGQSSHMSRTWALLALLLTGCSPLKSWSSILQVGLVAGMCVSWPPVCEYGTAYCAIYQLGGGTGTEVMVPTSPHPTTFSSRESYPQGHELSQESKAAPNTLQQLEELGLSLTGYSTQEF